MRLTRRVFDDLALWMIGVGLLIGIVFPPALVVLGVPREIAISPFFFGVCLLAGAVVGGVNILLARSIVMPKLQTLVDQMLKVVDGVQEATFSGDWSRCDPEDCQLPVDSDDVIGASAASFNQLISALSRSHEIEGRVSDFTKALSTQLELDPLCTEALHGFMGATGACAGAIFAVAGGELKAVASFGIVDTEALQGNDYVRSTLDTRASTYVELPEGLVVQAGLVDFQPREVAFLPLSLHSVPLGVVVLASPRAFEREVRPLVEIFARSFAVALSNAVTHDRLQRIAAWDPLTRCYNRRFGLRRLREEFTRAVRSDSPLGLILFDIDHFKSVNDTYGHLIGDRVLASIAAAAQQRLREGDVLMRFGGEEFVCILPGASTEDASMICERIRRLVEDCVVQDGDQEIRCTVSLGYTSFPAAQVEDEVGLLGLVDDALYRAKESGRNRAVRSAA